MYSRDLPNNVFVVERNLKSSGFYEFLPQATLCILVRVDNLLWHFLKKVKTFSSFFRWKGLDVEGYICHVRNVDIGEKMQKAFCDLDTFSISSDMLAIFEYSVGGDFF